MVLKVLEERYIVDDLEGFEAAFPAVFGGAALERVRQPVVNV